jgi:uncharacterized membrane protein
MLLAALLFLQTQFKQVPLVSNGNGVSCPTAINSSGEACGFVGWPVPFAARWNSAGNVTVLDGWRPSMAADIQDQGVVVGTAFMGTSGGQGSFPQPMLWAQAASILSPLGGGSAVATNQAGDLLLDMGGTTLLLPRVGGQVVFQGFSAGLADDGQICGSHYYATGAYRWSQGTFYDLPPAPGFTQSMAFDLTMEGVVVGRSSSATGDQATLWTLAGEPRTLPFARAGMTHSCAVAINRNGWIVGWEFSLNAVDPLTNPQVVAQIHAVLWIDGQAQELPLSQANDVNDRGQIVGTLGLRGLRLDPQ